MWGEKLSVFLVKALSSSIYDLCVATLVRLNLMMSFAVWLVYFAACKLCTIVNYGLSGVWSAHLLSVWLMFGSSIGAEYHGNLLLRTMTTSYIIFAV